MPAAPATLDRPRYPNAAPESRIPDTWSHLPPGPEREAAWFRWLVQDLCDRGMNDTARSFAKAHGLDWREIVNAPPPAPKTVPMSFGEDPFGAKQPLPTTTKNRKARAEFKTPLKQ